MNLSVEVPQAKWHSPKFSVHRDCGRWDTIILACHMIKVQCDFRGRTHQVSYNPFEFGGHRHPGNGDKF